MYNSGQPIDSSSPLFPFRRPASILGKNINGMPGQQQQPFLTAAEVIDTRRFGYTYDDFVLTRSTNQLYNRMNRLYGRPSDKDFRWFLYANCSTDNPNVTLSWQISIDPTFNASAADGILATGKAASSGSMQRGLRSVGQMSRRMLRSDAVPSEDNLDLENTLEASLGRTSLPHLMMYMGMLHQDASSNSTSTTGSNSTVWVSAASSFDITRFLRSNGVAGLNPAPLDPDSLAMGPATFPFPAASVGARCQNYYSGTDLPCQCQTSVSWVIADPGAFVDYVGPVPN